jgi:hypothetical protein
VIVVSGRGDKKSDDLAKPAEPDALRTALALSFLCENLDDLAELLAEDHALLDAVLDSVRHGSPNGVELAALLDALHTAVQRAGFAQGVHGERVRALTPMGVSRVDVVYRCPLRICTGRPREAVDGGVPRCAVAPGGMPLQRERLP